MGIKDFGNYIELRYCGTVTRVSDNGDCKHIRKLVRDGKRLSKKGIIDKSEINDYVCYALIGE